MLKTLNILAWLPLALVLLALGSLTACTQEGVANWLQNGTNYSLSGPPDGEDGYNSASSSSHVAATKSAGLVKVAATPAAGTADADTAAALGVNAYLWRGALDTLSFMPLVSADPFGGVIITDWYEPQGSTTERFKATAYVLGHKLQSDGIRVAIFRQVMTDGKWNDAPVSPGTSVAIENKVLARARELRAQTASN